MLSLKKPHPRSERGQAIIIIVLGIVGLLAFVGLMADGAILFIQYSRLKRAADAAAVSAALQYREGVDLPELYSSAAEFIQLNQLTAYNIMVDICESHEDPSSDPLCTTPRRKLVQVSVSMNVDFGFLPILGIDGTTIRTDATGEAASVDVVLVIDTSASMAFEGGGDPNQADDPADDPSACNPTRSCQPFEQIKSVAIDFVGTLYFPFDRVAIVAMTSQTADGTREPVLVLPLNATDGMTEAQAEATVVNALDNMRVFQPPRCPTAFGPCLNYNESDEYVGLGCTLFWDGADGIPGTSDDYTDPSSCTSSNIGGGLLRAGNEFAAHTPIREDSLWVVIVLVGGPANASDAADGFPYGYCPPTTWVPPFCRDADAQTRHSSGSAQYDADDYARDMADFVADPETGQGAVVYAIGLGNLIRNASQGDPDAGEVLLEYIAEESGGSLANRGIYYFAPGPAELREVFRSIAENIATRITQ
jgi:hypothetical protein